jgi:hypothetical protein
MSFMKTDKIAEMAVRQKIVRTTKTLVVFQRLPPDEKDELRIRINKDNVKELGTQNERYGAMLKPSRAVLQRQYKKSLTLFLLDIMDVQSLVKHVSDFLTY